VLISIAVITFEMPYYSLMVGAYSLIFLSVGVALLAAISLFVYTSGRVNGEDRYVAVGSSFLFSAVVAFAVVSASNRYYAQRHCGADSYTVVHYEARYSSAYGKIKEGKVKPNHWLLTVRMQEEDRTFTLREKISIDPVTNTVKLQFCEGIGNTQYLKI